MITKILKELKNNNFEKENFQYLLTVSNEEENRKLYDASSKIHNKNFKEKKYESNIYYPSIYKIENNCPNCGLRSLESRQKYSDNFIYKNLKYKLDDLNDYNITGLNCINKDTTGTRELSFILNYLRKYDLNINVKLSDINSLKNIKNYNINSIIYQSSRNKLSHLNENLSEKFEKIDEQLYEYIKEKMKINISYEFLINYGESYQDIADKINEIKKYDLNSINLKGFDPFLDSPEEYNPQYNKEYILKIISILRICFPRKEIKIQYATNGNNYLNEYFKLGITTLTGIYTPRMNSKLKNIEIIES